MRVEGLKKGFVLFVVFSMIGLYSMNIAVAETSGELNGDTLTINDPVLINGSKYIMDFLNKTGILISYGQISRENGTVRFKASELKLEQSINVTIKDESGFTLIFKPNIENKEFETPVPSTMGTFTPKPTPPLVSTNDSSIFTTIFTTISNLDTTWTILIILTLIILSISLLIYLGYLEFLFGTDSESSPLITSTNRLNVELTDESGFTRVKDAKVKAIAKSGGSYPASGIDGIYALELPKGTYKIEVDGGQNYENVSTNVTIPKTDRIPLTLTKRQPLQIVVVDEFGKPVRNIRVRVKEASATGVDTKGSPAETDFNGIANFTLSKNKQYISAFDASLGDYINPGNIPISNAETTKQIQLFKKAGTLEISVADTITGKPVAGIPVIATKISTKQTLQLVSDKNGKINQKLSVGDYSVRLKPGNFQLYESVEKPITINENRLTSSVLDFKFNYQSKQSHSSTIGTIHEKLETSYKEVSAYDTCIPLFFKTAGLKPVQLVERLLERPVEFLDSQTNPDEIIPYILNTSVFVSDEISKVMREKSNVDFYFSIHNLPVVNDLIVSDYSSEKFNELVKDTQNYHKNHFREIGDKLLKIDEEITQLSGKLTIQPVADFWRIAQKLQENCNNEPDIKKRGIMLFINDKLLDHVREMYTNEEVKARLKFSML